jgi:hypothetical protein
MVGILVHGNNHFIVPGPIPDDATALALAWHWSVTQIGESKSTCKDCTRRRDRFLLTHAPIGCAINSEAHISKLNNGKTRNQAKVTGIEGRNRITEVQCCAADIHAGSSDYWLNWVSSCGSEILRRSKPSE